MQFQIKIKSIRQFDDGRLKRVNEMFLFTNCESFTDAENQAYKLAEEHGLRAFAVTQILPVTFNDFVSFGDGGDLYYHARVSTTTIDADTGKDKNINYNYLIEALTLDEANSKIIDFAKQYLKYFEVIQVKKTKILEVIHEVK